MGNYFRLRSFVLNQTQPIKMIMRTFIFSLHVLNHPRETSCYQSGSWLPPLPASLHGMIIADLKSSGMLN